MKKIIASFLILFSFTIGSVPVSFAEGDGWIAMDAQDNVVSFSDGARTDIAVAADQVYDLVNADIAADQTVNVDILNPEGVPDPLARAIFNIGDGEASVWEGVLNVVGTAAFVNAFGFDIASGFQGNVQGGAVLSTLPISSESFFNGKAELSRELSQDPGFISNQGNFHLTEGSFLALVAGAVSNPGHIAAQGGAVVLGAGDKVVLDLTGGSGLISLSIDQPVAAPVFDFQGNKIGDAISNSGSLQANGGIAILSAKASEGVFDQVINHTGLIEANTLQEVNGRIFLDGGDRGVVAVAGELNAQGDDPGEKGGTVRVFGEKTALYAETRIHASGLHGGGSVLIGGDYQGLGSRQNSSFIYVDPLAEIKADALLEGNGGKIIVWADNAARVYGSLSARGGVLGGNGGLIETSGKHFFESSGLRVDASAPAGQSGLWLLDPEDADLENVPTSGGSFSGANPNVFTPTASPAKVNVADIEASLNNGTDVTILTGGSGAQPGNVRIKAAVNKTAGEDAIFKILADHDIELEATASILAATGALGIFFEAAHQIILRNFISTNGGDVTLNAANGIRFAEAEADITTDGGAFNANANTNNDDDGTFFTNGASPLTGSALINTAAGALNITGRRAEIGGWLKSTTGEIHVTAAKGFITIANNVITTGADVILDAKDGIDLNSEHADIRTGGGAVTAHANTDSDALGEFNQNDAGSVINSGAGKISLSGRQVGLAGTLRTTTGDIDLKAGDGAVSIHNTITTAGGAVDVQANNGILLDTAASDITTAGGKFTADADFNNDGTGFFTQSHTGSVINAGAGEVSIAGDGMDVDGTVRTTTGTQTLNAKTATLALSGTLESQNAKIEVNAANGIQIDGPAGVRTNGGEFKSNADNNSDHVGDFIQSNASSLVQTNGGNLSISGHRTDLDGTLRSGLGKISLIATGGFVAVSKMLEALGGDIEINAAHGINLDGPTDIRTTGGKFTANADSDANGTGTFFQSDALSIVNSADGDLSISGNKVDLDGSLESGAGLLKITSTGGLVSVSKALESTGNDIEINSVNGVTLDGPANILTAGGKFIANADSDANGTGLFSQTDPLSVIHSAGGEIAVSADKIDLDGDLRAGAGNIFLIATGAFVSVGKMLESAGGLIDIQAANGINLDGPTDIRTTGGKFNANADNDADTNGVFAQTDSLSVVNTAGGELLISGDKVDLDGSLRSGAGKMEITSTGGLLSISDMLETAGSDIKLHSANGISLDGPTDIRTAGGKFTANAATDFLQSDAGSQVSTGTGELSISSKRIDLDGTLKTTSGAIKLDATGGYVNAGNTLQTQGGNIDINALNGVSFDGPTFVQTNGGHLIANANTDNNGSGTFGQTDTLSTVSTSGGLISFTGVAGDLKGTLKSGNADISVTGTRGPVGLGKEVETEGGKVDVLAADGITLDGTAIRTAGGKFTGNADTDLDKEGLFTQTGAAGLISTGAGDIEISGHGVGLAGMLRTTSGKMDFTASGDSFTSGHTLLTEGGDITIHSAQGITLPDASVRTNGGHFTADANTNGDALGTFTQSGELTTAGGTGEILISAYEVDLDGLVDTDSGKIDITATGSFLRISNGMTTQGGPVDLKASRDLILDDDLADIRSNGAEIKLDADIDGDDDGEYRQTEGGSLIDTGGFNLTIKADDFNMGGTHRSIGAAAFLTPSRAGISHHLGYGVHADGEVNFKDGQADRIFADTLVIGSVDAGSMFAEDFSPANVNTLILLTGGSMAEEGLGDSLADITVPNLGIHSVSGVNVDIDVTQLAIQNDGVGAIHVEDRLGGMTVGTVGGFSGVSTLGGGITFLTHSPLTINQAVTSLGGGNITLAALGASLLDDLILNANVSAKGGNGNIELAAGHNLTLGPGVIVSAANAGAITAAAGEDLTDGLFNQNGNPLGDLIMAETSAFKSEDGNISVDAARNILLSTINANADNDKVSGNVITYSRTGKTSDANGTAMNIIGKHLTMLSYGDIGSKLDPIEISYSTKISKNSFPHCSSGKCDSKRYIKTRK